MTDQTTVSPNPGLPRGDQALSGRALQGSCREESVTISRRTPFDLANSGHNQEKIEEEEEYGFLIMGFEIFESLGEWGFVLETLLSGNLI